MNMQGAGYRPGPQLTKTSLISSIPYNQRRILCARLDVSDNWKKFVGFIKSTDGITPRYNDLHMLLFDKAGEKRHGSPTESLLNDWQTLRPTIGEFVDILKDVDLIATANYIHEDVLHLGPIKKPVQNDTCHDFHQNGAAGESLRPLSHGPASSLPSHHQFHSQPPSYDDEQPTGSLLDQDTMRSIRVYASANTLPFYSYNDLMFYTDNFNREKLEDGGRFVGRGGYGEVYLGIIKTAEEKQLVAVKRFHESSLEYMKQFKTELDMIFMNCHHRNLLEIKGICTDRHFCVLYEFMINGTLAQRLSSPSDSGALELNAERRLNIAIDIARGISRLHNGTRPIVHRDIKPANVLLDHDLVAKVGDYGLVRVQTLQDDSHTNMTTNVHGCKPYMPVEAMTGTVSTKWDVYSFGVVLLELLFAKGPMYTAEDGYCEKIIEYIYNGVDDIDPLSLLDVNCDWTHSVASQVLELSQKCAQNFRRRPQISGDENAVLETLLRIQERSKARVQ